MSSYNFYSVPSSSNRLGIFLFSSVLIVSVANIFNPFYNMFHNKKLHSNVIVRNRIRSSKSSLHSSNTADNIEGESDGQLVSEEGELIIYGTMNYHLGLWKLKCSSSNSSSNSKNNDCEFEIINELDGELILCWVDHQGKLHHYRQINDNSIKDKSVRNNHIEYTYTKDHFVCYRAPSSTSMKSSTSTTIPSSPIYLNDIPDEDFILSYTPHEPKIRHTLIIRKQQPPKRLFSLRSSVPSTSTSNMLTIVAEYSPIATEDDIIDSSNKLYHTCDIHGFHIYYEEDVFEQVVDFKRILSTDLSRLKQLLPMNACQQLQSSTNIYVNKSLTYGTTQKPVIASGCCYHPMGDSDWLRRNGLSVAKEGCVEIFNAAEYLDKRCYWGDGGILVHEFSHVYHNKYCPDGYDCEEIRQAYSEAMKAKLYHSVSVHGPQGAQGNTKAYACTNCMEFFAELSVAYLWNCDEQTEYNKWFPYNRYQLLSYDPATCIVLEKYWSQFE